MKTYKKMVTATCGETRYMVIEITGYIESGDGYKAVATLRWDHEPYARERVYDPEQLAEQATKMEQVFLEKWEKITLAFAEMSGAAKAIGFYEIEEISNE